MAKKNIIIGIGDEQDISRFKDVFFDSELKVAFAQTGKEVLRLADLKPPVLFIVHNQLRDMDGLACVKAIRNTPKFIESHLIQSDETSADFIHRCFEAHCDGSIDRDEDRNTILNKISEIITEVQDPLSLEMANQVRIRGPGLDGLAQTKKINSHWIWLRAKHQFSPTANYFLSFCLENEKDPIEVWARLQKWEPDQDETLAQFKFLNLNLKDKEKIEKRFPKKKPPPRPLPFAKIFWPAAIFFIMLVPLFWFLGPQPPSNLPSEISLKLKTPIPYTKLRSTGDHLFIVVAPEWKNLDSKEQLRLVQAVLGEIQEQKFKRIHLFDEKGRGLGTGRVRGKIDLIRPSE